MPGGDSIDTAGEESVHAFIRLQTDNGNRTARDTVHHEYFVEKKFTGGPGNDTDGFPAKLGRQCNPPVLSCHDAVFPSASADGGNKPNIRSLHDGQNEGEVCHRRQVCLTAQHGGRGVFPALIQFDVDFHPILFEETLLLSDQNRCGIDHCGNGKCQVFGRPGNLGPLHSVHVDCNEKKHGTDDGDYAEYGSIFTGHDGCGLLSDMGSGRQF